MGMHVYKARNEKLLIQKTHNRVVVVPKPFLTFCVLFFVFRQEQNLEVEDTLKVSNLAILVNAKSAVLDQFNVFNRS
jgi:hypothetical protein